MKKFFSFLMAITLCLSIAVPAFAADSSSAQSDTISLASTRSTDYGNAWISSASAGSFTVTTSKSGTLYMTLKVESSSNSSWAYVSVKKPNGSYYANNIYVDPTSEGGEGVHLKMTFASAGTYTIVYNAYTSVGMRLMCWIY